MTCLTRGCAAYPNRTQRGVTSARLMVWPTWILTLWVSILAFLPSATAQVPGADANNFNPALLHLFAQFKAFGCRADLQITDAAGKQVMRMPMGLHYLENKVRLEANLTELKSESIGTLETAMFKQVGMDQVITILRPDKKVSTIIFPSAKTYADNPLTAEELTQMKAAYELKVTPVATENIDGQPCQKQTFSVLSSNQPKLQGTLWRATTGANKNFPVRILIPQADGNLEMNLSQIKFQRPEATLFEAPNGFTKHPSVEAMLQSRLGSVLGGNR